VQHMHDAGFQEEHFTSLSMGIAMIYTGKKI